MNTGLKEFLWLKWVRRPKPYPTYFLNEIEIRDYKVLMQILGSNWSSSEPMQWQEPMQW